MKQFSTIVILLFVSLFSIAQKKRVVVIGSSTGSGYGLFYKDGIHQDLYTAANDSNAYAYQSWPNRYKRYLQAFNILDSLYNFSIWGEDIYQAYPTGSQIPSWALNGPAPDFNNNVTKALSVNPDYVIVNFPSNNYDDGNYTVPRVMLALRTIYNALTANGHTQCYIGTTEPREGFGATTAMNKMRPIRDSIIKEFPTRYINLWGGVVAANNWDVLPQYQNDSLPDGYDGVHYNARGHEIFYDSVIAKNIIPISTLPLVLTSFAAIVDGGDIVFTWQTKIESNVLGFELQQLKDGDSTWRTVGEVYSKAVGGNSTEPINYTFSIPVIVQTVSANLLLLCGLLGRRNKKLFFTIFAGMIILSCTKSKLETKQVTVHAMYRLHMIDKDGKATYSQIVHI